MIFCFPLTTHSRILARPFWQSDLEPWRGRLSPTNWFFLQRLFQPVPPVNDHLNFLEPRSHLPSFNSPSRPRRLSPPLKELPFPEFTSDPINESSASPSTPSSPPSGSMFPPMYLDVASHPFIPAYAKNLSVLIIPFLKEVLLPPLTFWFSAPLQFFELRGCLNSTAIPQFVFDHDLLASSGSHVKLHFLPSLDVL